LKALSLILLILFITTIARGQSLPGLTTIAPVQKDSSIGMPIRLIPENNYSKGLTFFCRNEWLLEKKTGVPFRFRLGSVDQVNWLEGKQRNYIIPPSKLYRSSESKSVRRTP
jgi:hypothetical protein